MASPHLARGKPGLLLAGKAKARPQHWRLPLSRNCADGVGLPAAHPEAMRGLLVEWRVTLRQTTIPGARTRDLA